MIIAQIDSINAQQIIPPLRKKVLRTLESLIKSNKTQDWFTIYVAVFLLLHNVSVISADRRRHGKANGATVCWFLVSGGDDFPSSPLNYLFFLSYPLSPAFSPGPLTWALPHLGPPSFMPSLTPTYTPTTARTPPRFHPEKEKNKVR